ncbi:MAG: hypothetical protein O3A93_07045 [Chloroflexi bacterium]|nr:hypothetical protein [Chloroflexota bacterium]MDA1271000.1 hypothetical protein [Chloroflexota bacterium]PKB58252.1 MAG: hypothetical protein BZY83_08000 [SAR202 cluster bacterium Casp-Chloro-G2]
MKSILNGRNPLFGVGLYNQRGITGLETAIVLIAFVVVAAVFAFAVITTGLFSSEKAAESASAGLGEASTTLTPKGAVVARANPALSSLSTVQFKMTNSGSAPVGLDPLSTLLTYTDTGNLVTLTRSASPTGIGETSPWWYSEWKLGTGNSLDSGEVVEITVGFFSTTDSGTTTSEGAVFSSTDTTLTVADGSVFAANDIIYLENEQMTITGIALNDLTVTRGDNGTTASAHADGLSIYDLDANQSISVPTNEPFKVELIPAQGAPFTVTRTSPVEITQIMDLG